jgi:predicted amidophosphoribosyltransferase
MEENAPITEPLKRCPFCQQPLDGVSRQRGVCRVCGKGLPFVGTKPAPRDPRIRHTEDERGRHGDER